jgi:predicted nucleotidyltransferase
MARSRIDIPKGHIADFCQRHHICRLSLFGSVLRNDFNPESDVDVLVEFERGTRVGLIRLARLELELGEILGRKVDLNTPGFLSKYYREQILAEAEVQYDAA